MKICIAGGGYNAAYVVSLFKDSKDHLVIINGDLDVCKYIAKATNWNDLFFCFKLTIKITNRSKLISNISIDRKEENTNLNIVPNFPNKFKSTVSPLLIY